MKKSFPTPEEIVSQLNFPRLAGSKGEKEAITKISTWVKSLGFSIEKQAFPVITSENGSAQITIGKDSFNAIPYGGAANGKFTAPLVFTENANAVRLNPAKHRNKIVLLVGRPRGIYHELINSGITGFISISPPYRKAQSLSHRQQENFIHSIPAATVQYEDGMRLSHLEGKPCTLKINQKTKTQTAYNLIITIPGTEPDDSITYFVGHYDTVSNSPGASDNTGGTAVLLHLLKYFSAHPPKREVKIIFFSGEEVGLIGSLAYCKQFESEIKQKGKLVINVDVSGDPIGSDELYITGSKELKGLSVALARASGIYCNNRLAIYSSDSVPFARLGIPSINIARYGGTGSFQGHTPDDHVRYISNEGLTNTLTVTQSIATHFAEAQIYPIDSIIDNSLRSQLEYYIYGLTGKEPLLQWPEAWKNPPLS